MKIPPGKKTNQMRVAFLNLRTVNAILGAAAGLFPCAAPCLELPKAPLPGPVPGLRIETRAYPAHKATEWQFRLGADREGSQVLHENLKSADFEVAFPKDATVTLHWNRGSHSETPLEPG
ncbi:MAG: hypothetical protein RLZZ253_1363 [Verrucomicrobiota bacterium]